MLMIRLPPGVPRIATRSSVSRKVGVMLESGRLPGAMALALPPTNPYTLGTPGLRLKSSISSFSNTPVPGTMNPEPKR